MKCKVIGDTVALADLRNIKNQPVQVPQPGKLVHLQFRRFAGCPICNLHLQSFFKNSAQLQENNIHEVVVFHASQERMLKDVIDVPFDLIADPSRQLYRAFGVESSWKAILNFKMMRGALNGVRKFGMKKPESLEAELGLPADFLIDESGKIVALKYGNHADDQWTLNEVIQHAKTEQVSA
ncbi:peroxiredoxin-like family protein [Marinobacter litoralis]|uniref:peroxiredoxin-like family protein n=1 Tax=Marinobacter litoralis TaxID=187981 RepID=UPI0018EE0500|nr:peroxiredoxin-like family protein [Marinobacter litoralis]MBJ6136995.1 AhpC/TSA family protein [Marinobacter litoralis]